MKLNIEIPETTRKFILETLGLCKKVEIVRVIEREELRAKLILNGQTIEFDTCSDRFRSGEILHYNIPLSAKDLRLEIIPAYVSSRLERD